MASGKQRGATGWAKASGGRGGETGGGICPGKGHLGVQQGWGPYRRMGRQGAAGPLQPEWGPYS